MKVAFPTSIPTIPKVDSTSVFIGFDSLLGNIEYIMALHDKLRNGSRLVQFGGASLGLEADTIIAGTLGGLDSVMSVQTNPRKYGVLVSPGDYAGYALAASMDYVSVIAVGASDGFDRVKFLVDLAQRGVLCQKPHWLYGVPNPAELSVYGKLLANFISNRIDLAICSTCFLYSVFGVSFSSDTGIVHALRGINDTRIADLGIAGWDNYEMSREQMRYFHMNADMVHSFASGMIAESYMGQVVSMLDLEVA